LVERRITQAVCVCGGKGEDGRGKEGGWRDRARWEAVAVERGAGCHHRNVIVTVKNGLGGVVSPVVEPRLRNDARAYRASDVRMYAATASYPASNVMYAAHARYQTRDVRMYAAHASYQARNFTTHDLGANESSKRFKNAARYIEHTYSIMEGRI